MPAPLERLVAVSTHYVCVHYLSSFREYSVTINKWQLFPALPQPHRPSWLTSVYCNFINLELVGILSDSHKFYAARHHFSLCLFHAQKRRIKAQPQRRWWRRLKIVRWQSLSQDWPKPESLELPLIIQLLIFYCLLTFVSANGLGTLLISPSHLYWE